MQSQVRRQMQVVLAAQVAEVADMAQPVQGRTCIWIWGERVIRRSIRRELSDGSLSADSVPSVGAAAASRLFPTTVLLAVVGSSNFIRDDNSPWTALGEMRVSGKTVYKVPVGGV